MELLERYTTNMEIETSVWKDVPGYDGHYQISDKGLVCVKKKGYWYLRMNQLTQGYYRLVLKNPKTGKKRCEAIHRLMYAAFTGIDLKGKALDHIDRNRTNNSLGNLRIATPAQNVQNQTKWLKKCRSKYKGVCWAAYTNRWRAYIKTNGKMISLGYWASEEDAALEYNKKAKELFGDYACFNVIEGIN